MKFIKQPWLIMLILLIAFLLFYGQAFRYFITYKSIGQRHNYAVVNAELKDYIKPVDANNKDPDIKEVIELALSLTSRQLHFSTSRSDIDPNKLIYSKGANCMGYATFFAATCNYLLNEYGMHKNWIAKPYAGQLYFAGINIHPYFDSSFFKDHDFVLVENRLTEEVVAVDPTIHDYFYLNTVTYSK